MHDFFQRLGLFFTNYLHFKPINGTRGFIFAILLSIVLFVVVMALLHRLPSRAKKWMMIVTTFVAGLYFTLEFFWPTHQNAQGDMVNWITPSVEPVSNYIVLVTVWMIGLGLISLVIVHWRRLLSRNQNWYHSLAFFLAMLAIIVAGFMSRTGNYAGMYLNAHEGSMTGANSLFLKAGVLYDTLFSGLLVNLDAAMFALLAFYIASAAYRAFRVRTLEAGLLMIAALIVMLGLVDAGTMLTRWIPLDSSWAFFRLDHIFGWLLGYWNMPAQRAVAIGVAIGSLAMAMRLWLSLERGTFFSQEK